MASDVVSARSTRNPPSSKSCPMLHLKARHAALADLSPTYSDQKIAEPKLASESPSFLHLLSCIKLLSQMHFVTPLRQKKRNDRLNSPLACNFQIPIMNFQYAIGNE